METKFTKGEWVIQNYNGKGSCIDIDTKIGNICQVYSLVETDYKTPHNEELIANAKLIAAAPESLIRLNESTQMLESMLLLYCENMSVITEFGIKQQILQNNQAIKKATE